jgi:crossover junction endodeoxyribonuclease RusA
LERSDDLHRGWLDVDRDCQCAEGQGALVMGSGGIITLPFPPASLSGHNTGHWRAKSPIVAKHRTWAKLATIAAEIAVPETGDIRISFTFYPPDNRGDRLNFVNRIKPYADGIAEALGVNDKRFLPSYHFGLPAKGGSIVVNIG